mmetsp:Transcript_32648/g.79178  ORF Transcript_32648/g.79178 Transcript_32648/m.79178 type:complete len:89 (+) Transcript_32648:837-1103(+)
MKTASDMPPKDSPRATVAVQLGPSDIPAHLPLWLPFPIKVLKILYGWNMPRSLKYIYHTTLSPDSAFKTITRSSETHETDVSFGIFEQ